MKKKEIEDKCLCGCTCDDNCECGCNDGKKCSCENNEYICECGCNCDEDLKVIDENYVLIGKKNDKKTLDAMKLLDESEAKYEFMDLDAAADEFKDVAKDMATKLEIPSVMVFQLIETGIISGIKDIENYFK